MTGWLTFEERWVEWSPLVFGVEWSPVACEGEWSPVTCDGVLTGHGQLRCCIDRTWADTKMRWYSDWTWATVMCIVWTLELPNTPIHTATPMHPPTPHFWQILPCICPPTHSGHCQPKYFDKTLVKIIFPLASRLDVCTQ